MTEAELDIKYETYKDKHEGYYIKMGMEYAREKMKRLFGEEYSIISKATETRDQKLFYYGLNIMKKGLSNHVQGFDS